jgi:hypothetical protein
MNLSIKPNNYLAYQERDEPSCKDVAKLVTFDTEENEYVFHLVEDLKRDSPREQLLRLQDKVLGYLEYAFSRDMLRDFPDSVSHSFRFQLYCFQPPRGLAKDMIEDTANRLNTLGIGFRVTVLR